MHKNTHKHYYSFITSKLIDLLPLQVNNAGASGVVVDADGLRALNIDPDSWVIKEFFGDCFQTHLLENDILIANTASRKGSQCRTRCD